MRTAELFGENEFLPFAPLKSGRVVPEERAAKMARRKELELGMVQCPRCGREAEVRIEGEASGQPVVYAGCFRTEECARRSVIGEGWDEEDGAREWNRRNGGVYGVWMRIRNWAREWLAEKSVEWIFRWRNFWVRKRKVSEGENTKEEG